MDARAFVRSRAAGPVAVAAFGLLLTLPRLGSFGLWEPWELGVADSARAALEGGASSAIGQAFAGGPPVRTLLPALGMALFGAHEWGARLLVALVAVGTLLAVFWAGASLFSRRAGLLAAAVLGTAAVFVLEARQLTSNLPLLLGGALAFGGLGRFTWPASGPRRWRDLAAGLAGLAIGTGGGGVLLGAVLPLLALGAAVGTCWSLRAEERGLGRSLLMDRRSVRAAFVLCAAAALVLLVLVLVSSHVAGRASWLLGGTVKTGARPSFEALVRQLGFGLFPWSTVAFFALGDPLVRLDAAVSAGRRLFGGLLALFVAAFGLALGTIAFRLVGEARLCILPAAAIATGAFLDDRLSSPRRDGVLALLAAVGTLVLARDFHQTPDQLGSLHLESKLTWPASLSIGTVVLALAALFGAGLVAMLAAPEAEAPLPRWRRQAARAGLPLALLTAAGFAFYLAQGIVPGVSRHLSLKTLLETYQRFGGAGAPLGTYNIARRGGRLFDRAPMTNLSTAQEVATFLGRPEAFALVPRSELGALDDALANVPYGVVDASSELYLLLAARLPAGAQDQNPLREKVWRAPASDPGARPPWPAPRVAISAVFGDAIELVGADFQPNIRRPGVLRLVLHFRVLRRPPASHRIFVHLRKAGEPIVNGDHDPLGGTFPTQHWRPGDHLRDEHTLELPFMTTNSGRYTLHFGFWPGGNNVRRIPVTAGPNDGENGIALGTVEVK